MDDSLADYDFDDILAAVNLGVPAPYIFAAGPNDCGDLPLLDRNWQGLCIHRLCATTRDFVEVRTSWRGAAPIVLIDVASIVRGCGDDYLDVARAVLVHELGHAATMFVAPSHEPPQYHGVALEWDRGGLEKILASYRDEPMMPPWVGHGRKFIRATLHAGWRAGNAGFNIHLDDLHVAGERYGLSHAWDYLATLDDEVFDLAHVPIADLENIDAPAAFDALWERDKNLYLKVA